jgi:hypothetical protein
MATTTNYGWTTPDDTALVKDGASAIRSLGTSVDTTTKNLNPSTTLGDIEYRSSTANTNTRLGIGSTGQILTVAGGVPSWAAPAAPSTPAFVGCMVYMGASMTLSNNSFTAVQFAETDYLDTDAFHNPITNNTRLTIPAGKGGKYLVYGNVMHDNGSGVVRVRFNLNGSVFSESRNGISTDETQHLSAIMTLAATDYVELIAYQNTGGNNDIYGTTDLAGVKATCFGLEFLGA